MHKNEIGNSKNISSKHKTDVKYSLFFGGGWGKHGGADDVISRRRLLTARAAELAANM
jgi:hypothetical protein